MGLVLILSCLAYNKLSVDDSSSTILISVTSFSKSNSSSPFDIFRRLYIMMYVPVSEVEIFVNDLEKDNNL